MCSAVVSNWKDLEGKLKTKAGIEVQKKWHSLRSCFARELRFQKQGKPESGTKKRRKYIYFEKLLFLLPSMENRETRSNLDDRTSSGLKDEDCNETKDRGAPQRRPGGPCRQTKASRKDCFEESILEVLEKKKTIWMRT